MHAEWKRSKVRLFAGIAELVQKLQERQTAVYLVSGGFRPIINPIAELLKIPLKNVYANTILHDVSLSRVAPPGCASKMCIPACCMCLSIARCAADWNVQDIVDIRNVGMQENGEYTGFDTSEFTSRTGGKPAAIKAIKVPFAMLCSSPTLLDLADRA